MTRENALERWAHLKPKPSQQFSQTSLSNLLHEFTHYLAAGDASQIYPLWYTEGLAEYLSSMSFARRGRVQFGLPLAYRLETVRRSRWIPTEKILGTSHFKNQQRGYLQSFYAQSWLMTSWFYAEPERRERLNNYLRALVGAYSAIQGCLVC